MAAYTKEYDWPANLIDVDQFDCDLQSPGDAPANIVHAGAPVNMRIKWRQNGAAYPFLAMGFNWHIRIYLEQFGPGEGAPPPFISAVPLVGAVMHDYNVNIPIPPLGPGVYKAIVTLNLYAPGDVTTLFHSFEEAGVIEVVAP